MGKPKCNEIKCNSKAVLIKNDNYYCAGCYIERFIKEEVNDE